MAADSEKKGMDWVSFGVGFALGAVTGVGGTLGYQIMTTPEEPGTGSTTNNKPANAAK